jgi:CheY-like chemotaxis protein
MTDEILSLKMLIVSEAAPERELIRRAALKGSVPIEVTEIETAGDASAARAAIDGGKLDTVFFDSRMPKLERQILLEAIRTGPGRPLAVLVGASQLKTREVITEGLDVDGVLAKPIDIQEARDVIERCIRARALNRVLIVDDSSTVRSVVRKVLQASAFRMEAEEASDGAEAIARAKNQRFDLIFLDCQMPNVDGFAALAALKISQSNAKVIMMTGTRDIRIEDRARAEGCAEFLYKPFFAKDIDALLARLMGLMRVPKV